MRCTIVLEFDNGDGSVVTRVDACLVDVRRLPIRVESVMSRRRRWSCSSRPSSFVSWRSHKSAITMYTSVTKIGLARQTLLL